MKIQYRSCRLFTTPAIAGILAITSLNLTQAAPQRELPTAETIPALQAAAEADDPAAQFDLARAYFRGIGVEKDAARSVALLESSAAKNFAPAHEALAYLYAEGIGVEKDEEKALALFLKGAEAGLPISQLNCGIFLREGRGTAVAHEEGLQWITKASDAGLAEARYYLGELFFLGDDHQPKDYEKAIPLLLPEAEAGRAKAQNMIGVAHRDGFGGLKTDSQEAEKWFRLAAVQGDRKAQSNLGHLIGPPTDVSPRQVESLAWLLIAEQNGEPAAKKTLIELRPVIGVNTLVQAEKMAKDFHVNKTVPTTPAPEQSNETAE